MRLRLTRTLSRTLGVGDELLPRAVRLSALVFLTSFAMAMGKAAQSGIFLSAWTRADIPWAFAASAVVLASLSALTVAVTPRFGPLKLTQATLVLSAAAVAVLAILFGNRAAAFATYVVMEAVSGLLVVQVWSLVSGVLDPRTAKRVLPVAGVGAGLAWTIGGLGTTPIVHLVGARGLLVIGPLLMLGAAAVTQRIGRHDLAAERSPRRSTGLLDGWQRGFRLMLTTPLLRFVLALGVLGIVAEQLMDFQLMSAARETHESPASLTAFFGRFYGVTSGLGMVLSLALSGRLMARLGAPRVVLTAPAVLTFTSMAAALFPSLATVVAQRGTDRVLKAAFYTSAVDQLQTPLRPVERTQSRALIRGVVAPLAYGLVSLLLAALPATFDLRWLAAVNVVAALATVAVGAGIRRVYVNALHHAVDERSLVLDSGSEEGEATTVVDLETCRALERELLSGDTSRALVAAEILASTGGPEAREVLETHGLSHPEAEVRALAVEGLSRQRTMQVAQRLAAVLMADGDPRVRLEAVHALRKIGRRDPAIHQALERGATDEDEGVRAWCRIALAEHDDVKEGASLKVLTPLFRSASKVERLAALNATPPSLAREPLLHVELSALLSHEDVDTRLAALKVVARYRIQALLPRLAPLFDDPQTAPFAFEQLGSWGSAALESAWTTQVEQPAGGRESVALINESGLMRSVAPATDGLSVLDNSARENGAGGAAKLIKRGRVPKAIILPLLQRDISRAYGVTAIEVKLASEDGGAERDFLAHELALESRDLRERILNVLSLADDRGMIRSVDVALRSGGQEAHVAELLEMTVKQPLASHLVPLFDRLAPRERLERGYQLNVLAGPSPRDVVEAVLRHGDAHLRGCAMVTYGPRVKQSLRALWEVEAPVIPLYERLRFLRGVPLFVDLSGDDLRQIAGILAPVSIGHGEVIFNKGDAGDEMFVIMRGKVAIRDGDVQLAMLGPRDFFGELAVLDREPRSAGAFCVEDCDLLRLKGPDLHELLARRPGIQHQLMLALVRRIRDIGKRVAG